MNEVIENLETRRSVRNYKPDMVPREVLDQQTPADPVIDTFADLTDLDALLAD